MNVNKIYCGDALEVLKTFASESIDMVITSPPYYSLRDYGVKGQIGLEPTFNEYINNLCNIFDEVKRVLKPKGSCWVNLGDSYGGTGTGQEKSMESKNKQTAGQYELAKVAREAKAKATKGLFDKCLLQIPSRFAIEMTNRGWILRNEIIWHKPNCMPSSVKDRFTVDFEKLFFFTKSKKYYFEQQKEPIKQESIKRYNAGFNDTKKRKSLRETGSANHELTKVPPYDGRNKRTVWEIRTKPLKEEHFAAFPEELVETPILATCPLNGIVLDIFMGSGTTGIVAKKLGINFIGIELNPKYVVMAEKRINNTHYQYELELF